MAVRSGIAVWCHTKQGCLCSDLPIQTCLIALALVLRAVVTLVFIAASCRPATTIWAPTDRVIEVLSVPNRSSSVTDARESWVSTVAVRSATEASTELTITDCDLRFTHLWEEACAVGESTMTTVFGIPR